MGPVFDSLIFAKYLGWKTGRPVDPPRPPPLPLDIFILLNTVGLYFSFLLFDILYNFIVLLSVPPLTQTLKDGKATVR